MEHPASSIAAATLVPTIADTERIAALADPVVRNLQITQCYHELATALAARIAGDANWCVFATWASKQAGQTIRGEDLRDALEHVFDRSPVLDAVLERVAARLRSLGVQRDVRELRRLVRGVFDPEAILARASAAVARGNLKVFAEIGREFARFCAEPVHDAGAIASFCSALRDGEAPDGQRFLRQAFTHYHQASLESDAKARSALALLANLEVGFHEQTRLQPEIREALDAAVSDPDELTRRLLAAVFPHPSDWLTRARGSLRKLFGGATPLEHAVRELVERVRREVRLVVTEHVMTLSLARGVRVRLGADLELEFPPSLAQLEHPELLAFLARVDPTPDSLRASGASDWGVLAERMHFIADLFRGYHAAPALLDAPFEPAQLLELRAGRRPTGRL